MRRNCDLDEDYWAQSEVLLKRFLEKGCNLCDPEKVRLEVSNSNRNVVADQAKRKENKFELAFGMG